MKPFGHRQVTPQDAINARVYHAASVVRHYPSDLLEKAEVSALLRYQPWFVDSDVLDVGVGTGRTAFYLALLARNYVAIDYSPVMVKEVRARMPHVQVHQADMRDLSAFASGSFDFILATNNVLDAVSHADRLLALQEMRRVLRPHGMLMFSAHNRCYEHANAPPRLKLSRNPVSFLRNLITYGRRWRNYLRLRKAHRQEESYALLTDSGHDHGCLHYYIDRDAQAQQLRAMGFKLLDVFSVWGRPLAFEDFGETSPWLMYVAQL